jgi:hypothetical protein
MDEAKMARTESAFREVNEAIARTARRFEAGHVQFICECSDPECAERVSMALREYEALRARPTWFVLAPRHHQPGLERLIERTADYEKVEKVTPTLRRVVRRLDPRSRPQPEIT